MSRAITADGRRAGALLIERSYLEGDDRQFLRELVQNGIEAGASKVQLGIHWSGVDRDWSDVECPDGHTKRIFSDRYRLVYYDNGCGMGERMADYMAGLLDLDSKNQGAGDVHGNFAMGVRVSTLPWNKAGLIVASWTEDCPQGRLMWLRYVPDTTEEHGYYEAATLTWEDEDGNEISDEVAPADLFPEFIDDRPAWLGHKSESDGAFGTGTMFLFLGNTGQEHTFLGPDGTWKTHTGPNYLTHRYFEHPEGFELRYEDPRSSDMDTWSLRYRDRKERTALDASSELSTDTRVLNEPVRPTGPLMAGNFMKGNDLPESGEIPMSDGGRIVVHLMPAVKKASGGGRQLAERPGISVLYKNELYHRRDSARDYQRFGISSSSVYRRLSIVVEPRKLAERGDTQGGVFPTGSRTSLQYVAPSEDGNVGRDLPWNDWQQCFLDHMPEFVIAAIEAAQPADTTDLDQDIVEKVAQPFMDMFKSVRWTKSSKGDAAGTDDDSGRGGSSGRRKNRRSRRRNPVGSGSTGSTGGGMKGANRNAPASIPECIFDEGAFSDEERSAEIRVGVKYMPGRKGHAGRVIIDPKFPLIEDRVDYWLERTAPPQHEEARKAVKVVYATAMACRVGQVLALGQESRVTVSALTSDLMSNEALTCSLFGLASEHEVIKTRLSRRVRKVKGRGVVGDRIVSAS